MNGVVSTLTRLAVNSNCALEQIDLVKSNLTLCSEALFHKSKDDDITDYLAMRLLIADLSEVWDLMDEVCKDLAVLIQDEGKE